MAKTPLSVALDRIDAVYKPKLASLKSAGKRDKLVRLQAVYDRARRTIVRHFAGSARIETAPIGATCASERDAWRAVMTPKQAREAEAALRDQAVAEARQRGSARLIRIDEPSYVREDPRKTSREVRALSDKEKHAIEASIAAQAIAPHASVPEEQSSGTTIALLPGYCLASKVVNAKGELGGIIKPAEKPVTRLADDPRVKAIRARVLAGEITMAEGRAMVNDLPPPEKADRDAQGRPIKAEGFALQGRLSDGAPRYVAGASNGFADCSAKPEHEVPFMLFDEAGKPSNLSAPHGDRAIGLSKELLLHGVSPHDSKTDVITSEHNWIDIYPAMPAYVQFTTGVLAWFPTYMALCPACFGKGRDRDTGRTCNACEGEGRVSKAGFRAYFGPECEYCRGSGHKKNGDDCDRCHGSGTDPLSPKQRAENAKLAAMTGFDAHAECGHEKCKGQSPEVIAIGERFAAGELDESEAIQMTRAVVIPTAKNEKGKEKPVYCHACKAAAIGGYARDMWIKCPTCKGTGKDHGQDCLKCHGRRGFWGKEYFWSNNGAVVDTIRRCDLLAEQATPKRERNIAYQVGDSTLYKGPGKPKVGPAMHLQGTARNDFSRAASNPMAQGGWGFGVTSHPSRNTESGG